MSETIVSLRHGTTRGSLHLQRAPLFLRFVMRGTDWSTLNALDQLDDAPKPGETVYAAVKVDSAGMHVDRVVNRRRVGEWYQTATYELVPDQPDQEILQDATEWKAWATAQHAARQSK